MSVSFANRVTITLYDYTSDTWYIPENSSSFLGRLNLTDTSPLTIGNNNEDTGNLFSGQIDEITVFDRALLFDEIESIKNDTYVSQPSFGVRTSMQKVDAILDEASFPINELKITQQCAEVYYSADNIANLVTSTQRMIVTYVKVPYFYKENEDTQLSYGVFNDTQYGISLHNLKTYPYGLGSIFLESNFLESYELKDAFSSSVLEINTSDDGAPFRVFFCRKRLQTFIYASELQEIGLSINTSLKGIFLRMGENLPQTPINNLRVRIQETDDATPQTGFVVSGWTTLCEKRTH